MLEIKDFVTNEVKVKGTKEDILKWMETNLNKDLSIRISKNRIAYALQPHHKLYSNNKRVYP